MTASPTDRIEVIRGAGRAALVLQRTRRELLAQLAEPDSAAGLARYTELFEASWAKEELWRVRNFRQAFDHGFFAGVLDAGMQLVTGGRGFVGHR